MDKTTPRIAIIGGGIMGLSAAYSLCRKGFSPTIFEIEKELGGMSSSFDFNGLTIEKYYHYICKPDKPLFELLKELHIEDRLRWKPCKVGFLYHGTLYKWNSPFDILAFPQCDILTRLKYGFHAYNMTKRSDWAYLDKLNAVTWITDWIGERGYSIFWESLFKLKFHEFTKSLSAAWISSRVRRMGLSRKNIFSTELGYLEGGSTILIKTLEREILKYGGNIFTDCGVEKIFINDNGTKKLLDKERNYHTFDYVLSTIPIPLIPKMIPCLNEVQKKKYESIINIPVVCVIIKSKHSLTENFWLNINDPRFEIPGIVEYTNLNALDDKIVYLPYYLPPKHPLLEKDDAFFFNRSKELLSMVKPSFVSTDIIDFNVFRYKYAQPICQPEFYSLIPKIRSEINGLFIADTSHYYPEDRSMSESILLGKRLSNLVEESIKSQCQI